MRALLFGRASTLLVVPFLLFGLVAISCDDEADEPSGIGIVADELTALAE